MHYPWLEVPAHGGFFVPTLKFEEVRVNGLKAALYHRVQAKAEIGRKNGKIGGVVYTPTLDLKSLAKSILSCLTRSNSFLF